MTYRYKGGAIGMDLTIVSNIYKCEWDRGS